MSKKKDYESFVESFMVNYSDKEREFAGFLLESDDVKDSYKSLVDGNVTEEKINEIFKTSIKNVQKQKKSTPDKFVKELSNNLAKIGKHQSVLDDFFNKGLIPEKHKEKISETNVMASEGSKYVKGIIMGFIIMAVFFFLKSLISGSFISAVIGGGTVDYDIIYGTVFLLFGLALAHCTYKKEING